MHSGVVLCFVMEDMGTPVFWFSFFCFALFAKTLGQVEQVYTNHKESDCITKSVVWSQFLQCPCYPYHKGNLRALLVKVQTPGS